jgi:tetratricopeptide (TPR) repeat protein
MGIRQFFEILLGIGDQNAAAPATEMQRWQHALSGGAQARRRGDFDEAGEIYDEILQEVRQAGNPMAEATVLGHIGTLYTEAQRWKDAERVLDEALVIARQHHNPVLLAAVLNDRGNYYVARGETAQAQEVFNEALNEARHGLDSRLTAHILGHLADLYMAENNASYARRLLEEANQITHFQTPAYVGRLGEAAIATGHDVEGHRWVVQALRLAHAMGDQDEEIHWATALARRYSADGKYQEASRLYQRAAGLISRVEAIAPEVKARFLLDRAEVSYQIGRPEEAVKYAEEGVALAESLDMGEDVTRARGLLGTIYRALGRPEQSVDTLRTALESLPAEALPTESIGLRLELARVQLESDPQAAEDNYRQAADAARAAGESELLARALVYLGRIRHQAGESQAALDLWREAAQLFEAAGDQRQLVSLQCDIANVLRDQGEYKQALTLYEQALVALNNVNHPPTRGVVLSNVANMYTDTGDIETSKAFYDEAIAIARDTGDQAAESLRLGNLGWFYIVTGGYNDAINALEAALRLSEQLKATLMQAVQRNNLALAHARMGHYDLALDLHEQALGEIEGKDQPRWRAIFESNLGETLVRQGKYEAACPKLDEALALSREVHYEISVARTLWRLGDCQRLSGQLDAAEASYTEAISVARRMGDQRDMALAILGQGLLAQALERGDRARELLGEAQRVLGILHAPERAQAESALSQLG